MPKGSPRGSRIVGREAGRTSFAGLVLSSPTHATSGSSESRACDPVPRAVAGLAALLALAAAPRAARAAGPRPHPLRDRAPAEAHRAGGRVRRARGPREPAGPARAADRAARGARAGHQPQQARPIRSSCSPAAPGQAASAFYATVAGAFERIHRERDIVLVDQRGTGGLEPARLPGGRRRALPEHGRRDRPRDAPLPRGALRASARRVLHHERSRSRTSSAVRAALGYERLDLYGVSYGTRVAQQYLRAYPARVRAVILDGVVPPSLVLGPAVATDAQRALVRHPRALRRPTAPATPASPTRSPTTTAVRAALAAHAVRGQRPRPVLRRAAPVQLRSRPAGAGRCACGSYASEYAVAPAAAPAHGGGRRLRAARGAVPAAEALLRGRRDRHAQQRRVLRGRAVHRIRAPSTAPRSRAPTSAPPSSTVSPSSARLWPRGPVAADLHTPLHERRARAAALRER